MQETLNLFKKTIKKEDNSKFDTYFMMNAENQSIKVKLTDDAKAEILKSGIQFPLAVTLDEDDYFITTETYTNNDGLKQKVAVCIITKFTKLEKANLEKRTLTDYFKDQAIEDKGIKA